MSPHPTSTPIRHHPSATWPVAAARALHPSSADLDEGLLPAIAIGLGSVAIPWELRTGAMPVERRYELLLATPAYEAWLIYWPPGGSLELHDHGGSNGAFCVVAGQLDEAVAAGGAVTTRRLGAGRCVAFGPGHIHDVLNPRAVGATSVHVYSPRLASMTFYERDAAGHLVATHTERFDHFGHDKLRP